MTSGLCSLSSMNGASSKMSATNNTTGSFALKEPQYMTVGLDRCGRLFMHEGAVYRGLTPKGLATYNHMLYKGALDRLFQIGLVPTEFAKLTMEQYPAIVLHKKLPFISYCREWSFGMLKQAALLQCRIARETIPIGLTTKDAHPWNVAFDYTRPVFLDLGSIDFLCNFSMDHWISEFRTHYYIPLWLAANKRFRLARWCTKEDHGPIKEVLSHRVIKNIMMTYQHLTCEARKKGFLFFLNALIDHIESLNVLPVQGEWSNYSQDTWKEEFVGKVLRDLSINTAIDMGANKGQYSIAASDAGLSVVAFDIDEHCVDYLFEKAHHQKRLVLPLVIDFLYPTPASNMNLFYTNSFDRLRCDIGIALALVHHLVFRSNVNFEIIASIINRYVYRYALVEYISIEDKHVLKFDGFDEAKREWYTEKKFVNEFMRYFKSFKVWPTPLDTRKIYLFER